MKLFLTFSIAFFLAVNAVRFIALMAATRTFSFMSFVISSIDFTIIIF